MTSLFVHVFVDEELHTADIVPLGLAMDQLDLDGYEDRIKIFFHDLNEGQKEIVVLYFMEDKAVSFVGLYDMQAYYWKALGMLELEEKKKRKRKK